MNELQSTAALSTQDHVDPSEVIEEQLQQHLGQIKDELLAWQAFQQQASDLREEKATLTEQLKVREQQVSELTRRIEVMEQHQDDLVKNNSNLLEQMQLRPVGQEADTDPQELTDLKTELEQVQSALAAKEHELEELRSEMGTAKSKVSA
jgi:predicted  nucleic acid-binding Zn-ribbon protein